MKTHNASEHEALQNFISDGTPLAIRARYASLPEAAAQSDYGDLDRNIVVIDTETTGFSLNHDELTQIAAARMERGEITDWFITFVNPGKPIPEDVVHTHRHPRRGRGRCPAPRRGVGGAGRVRGRRETGRTQRRIRPQLHDEASERLPAAGKHVDRLARPGAHIFAAHEIAPSARPGARVRSTAVRRTAPTPTWRRRAACSASCWQPCTPCRRRSCARSPAWRRESNGQPPSCSSISPKRRSPTVT